MKNLRLFMGIIITSTILAGCGGDDGDTTPPSLTATAHTTLQTLTVNVPMAPFTPLSASGGKAPYTYSHTGVLPNGLIYSNSGVISGTPATTYFTTLTFLVQDSAGVIAGTTSTVSITVSSLPTYSTSGFVKGGARVGVTITVFPSGTTTTTAPDGGYSVSDLVNNTYTITPSDDKGTVFSPASQQVVVGGSSVVGVDFTTPTPMQTTGKLIFASNQAASVKDLSTGIESVLWGLSSKWPDLFSVSRTGGIFVFNGSNLNCLMVMSLSSRTASCLAPSAAEFDISESGDVAVVSKIFEFIGSNDIQQNIVLYKLDSARGSFRVTNGPDADVLPAVCSRGNVTTGGDFCFVRGTEILKVSVDLVNNTVSTPVTIATSAAGGIVRAMSFSPDYTQMVFAKNVGGVAHIVVKSNGVGGTEVDLGPGSDPYWALDGSNRIKFTWNRLVWTMLPDGSGLSSLPTPTNIYQFGDEMSVLLSRMIFMPIGY